MKIAGLQYESIIGHASDSTGSDLLFRKYVWCQFGYYNSSSLNAALLLEKEICGFRVIYLQSESVEAYFKLGRQSA